MDSSSNHAKPSDAPIALGLGNLRASAGDHIGHFYESDEEWKRILVAFLKTGLANGDKCVYFVSRDEVRHELEEELRGADIDVDDRLESGQLVLDLGKSDPEEMQQALEQALAQVPHPYPFLRWGGEMTWSLGKLPSTEKLMEWETHCNTVDNPPAIFLCQYDLRVFQGSVVMDALRTHPVCVVSNVIHQNPYYEDPEAFLERLRSRAVAGPPA